MVLFAGKLYKRVSLFTLSFVLAISSLVVAVPLYFSQVAHASTNVVTSGATAITSTDAILNGANGSNYATGHSFWVSLASFATTSPTIPNGVYSTPVLGAVAANSNFSASLSSITTTGVPMSLPSIVSNTTYYYTAWSLVDGTWYPGDVSSFTTGPIGSVFIDTNSDGILNPGEQTFSTIQAAIVVASSGSTIRVLTGNYTEVGQIVIDKNLTIVGADKTTTIIKPTANTGSDGDSKGWFVVNSGKTLTLSNVTLDGADKQIFQAVRVNGAIVANNVVLKNISYPGYQGFGIVLNLGSSANNKIQNSTFVNIGREGVLVYGAGTGATISDNNYTGKGNGDWLDYAFEVGAGATATITGNIISNNTGGALSDGSTSAGIMATTYFGDGTQATITGNIISDSTDAIAVGYNASDTSIVVAHKNQFIGNVNGVNSTNHTVDATQNWWGSATGPGDVGYGTGDKVSTNVNYKSWCTDSGCTTFSSDYPTTTAATVVTSTTATLNGIVGTSNADNTSFWWGTSSAGPFTSAVNPSSQLGDWSHASIGTGAQSTGDPFSYVLTGLAPSTPYYFVAWSQVDGIWYPGTISSFNTADKYTQTDFKAFDGVAIGTNSYTESSHITATYTAGTGTEIDPVKLTLTGYAPIVTPWFGPDWATYNYVTIGIKLPAGFSGTSVYDAGVMRYDRNPGTFEMGTGSTDLATGGAAKDYLDYSFAANSPNTKKDGLVKLMVIWTAGGTSEYFTIDITGLQLAPNSPTATLTANGVSVSTNGYTNSNTFTFNLSSADATRYQLKYWNDIVSSSYKEGTPWNSMTLGAVYPDSFTQGEGTHYFAFSACNAASNCSNYSTPFAVTYDKTAPVAKITTPITSAVLGSVDVRGTVTDANPDHYYLVIQNSSNAVIAGLNTIYDSTSFSDKSLFIWNTKLVSDGVYTIRLEARDAANNKDNSISVDTKSVTVDNTPPVITINSYNTGWTNGDVIVAASTNEGVLNATSHQFTENGSFTFVATDSAGNSSSKIVTITNIDKTAPTMIVNPINTTGNQPTITGTVDTSAISLTVTIDGTALTVTRNGTTWSAPVVSSLADGSHTVVAIAIDALGNRSTVSQPITVATVITPSTPPTPDSTVITTTTTGEPVTTTDVAILGAQTSKDSTDKSSDSTKKAASILGDTTAKDNSSIWGLAWYWWLVILAAVAAIIWWIIAAMRSRDNQNA